MRRVQLVRRDGRDVSTLYGREAWGGGRGRLHGDSAAVGRRGGERARARGEEMRACFVRKGAAGALDLG